jgi:hypothetical protein
LKAEKARRRLHEFVVQAWPVLEPDTTFVDGIHVQAICDHLQAITEGRIRNLIINVPPGHAKSLLTAVFWPAWVWTSYPETRWLFSSYREPLATRDSVKCRRLIESEWYQERWGSQYQLSGDQNQKNRFENTATGYRIVVPMSAGTGERGDYVVVDDPHSVDQAESEGERRRVIEWWNGSMSTRLNDFATGHQIVIQQRLHEADLTGDLLQRGGYELLCLPAEFEPERKCCTSIGWSDPRREVGELLWPQKVTAEDLASLKVTLGSYRYAGQYQQRPAGRGWYHQAILVALLEAGTSGPAARPGTNSRRGNAEHPRGSDSGAVRNRDSVLGHGLQSSGHERLCGRPGVGGDQGRPFPVGSVPRPAGSAIDQRGGQEDVPALAQSGYQTD